MGFMIYDLAYIVRNLKGETVADRLEELCHQLYPVSIVALNGIPFIQNGYEMTYFHMPVEEDDIREELLNALGLGAVLTHLTPGKELHELAELSLENDHDWAFHSVNITLCFAGCPTFVEMSFARDSRFHLSWVEPKAKTDWSKPRVFIATASLKTWKKYIRNRQNPDFLSTQRKWMLIAHDQLKGILPEYFGSH
jgi:hypothetical protein